MTKPIYQSRYDQPDSLSWARICGIAFAVTVQALVFMMLLVPPTVDDAKQKEDVNPATIIEPPKPKEKPPEIKPEIKTPPPKDIPPPPKIENPPPPPPTPPVILDTPNSVSPPAPIQAPPTPPPVAQSTEASIDISYQNHNPPDYPREELNNGVTGVVVLLVTVDENGNVVNVAIEKKSGNRNLDRSAQDAARKWRFNPALKNGLKAGGVVRVPVEFKL